MDDYCKRSGQIPAFGNWDYSNELPITQYFECARQAGLIRYSSSSGESDPYIRRSGGAGGGDLYAVDDLRKGYRNVAHPRKLQTRVREKRGAHVKDQNKKQHVVKKVCDVTEPPRKPPPPPHFSNNNINKLKHHNVVAVAVAPTRPVRPPKAVDEDLYKIPPELLHSSKRKKMPGFFSCLVPTCAS